jgi:hypothetical protein
LQGNISFDATASADGQWSFRLGQYREFSAYRDAKGEMATLSKPGAFLQTLTVQVRASDAAITGIGTDVIFNSPA